jgi:hypothetical protein
MNPGVEQPQYWRRSMTQQSSRTHKQSGKQKQEANLGQKEAGQEKEKKSELSSMGEKSRESQRGS